MRSRSHRKRPGLATSMEALTGELSRGLFKRYGQDNGFVVEVKALVERHQQALPDLNQPSHVGWSVLTRDATEHPRMHDYLDELKELAQSWGLGEFPNERGFEALHLWVLRWRGQEKPIVSFGTGLIWRHSHAPLASVNRSIEIFITDTWDPTSEVMNAPRTRVDPAHREFVRKRTTVPAHGAKPRILARCEAIIDAELERIAAEVEAAGFTFEDTTGQRDVHLDWTYARLAHRAPVATIADAAFVSENAVRKATDRMKTIIGLSRFPTSKRRPKK